jgi:uncharacterized protein
MRLTIIAILFLNVSPAASAQGVDCRKARTRIEKMVCADQGLRDLDEHLGRYYAAARIELGRAASCLQSDQAQWLKVTRDACPNASCLKTVYLNRLGELDALQPGATALKNLALPRVPSLAWVIAPAADKTAAPPKPNAEPLELFGAVIDDVAGGDGFIFRTGDGKKLPLVLSMLLDPIDQQHLAAIAKEKGMSFRARGYEASDSTRTYFEPSRCTFIHRFPTVARQ